MVPLCFVQALRPVPHRAPSSPRRYDGRIPLCLLQCSTHSSQSELHRNIAPLPRTGRQLSEGFSFGYSLCSNAFILYTCNIVTNYSNEVSVCQVLFAAEGRGKKKRASTEVETLSWQREKDSNPHIRSQSPLCYLYTIPLYCRTNDIIPQIFQKSIGNRRFFEKITPICHYFFWR